jgi:serine/threonine-protein kinase
VELIQTSSEAVRAGDRLIGRLIDGRYTVLEQIGRGGMGKVFKAHQSPLDRVVALKVLSLDAGQARDLEFEKRFFLEASITARLNHPNTVTIFDYGHTRDGVFYIAMEYLEGRVLSEILAAGALPWLRALGIVAQVARSIRQAHNYGVIHRDLKAGNVMIVPGPDGEDLAKVFDFGLVKYVGGAGLAGGLTSVGEGRSVPSLSPAPGIEGEDLTATGFWFGSPAYVAPEQACLLAVDPRTDIYSLGVLFWQMLVGRMPFVGNSPFETIAKQIYELPVCPSTANPCGGIPPQLDAVVMMMLQKSPEHRFQSMDHLLAALKAIGAPPALPGDCSAMVLAVPLAAPESEEVLERVDTEEPPSLPPAESPAPSRAWSRKAYAAALGAGAALLLGGMALAELFHRGQGAVGAAPSRPASPATSSSSLAQPAVALPAPSPPVQAAAAPLAPSPSAPPAAETSSPPSLPPPPAVANVASPSEPAAAKPTAALPPPALAPALGRPARGGTPPAPAAVPRKELASRPIHPAPALPESSPLPERPSSTEAPLKPEPKASPERSTAREEALPRQDETQGERFLPQPNLAATAALPESPPAPTGSPAIAAVAEPLYLAAEAVYERRIAGRAPVFPRAALNAETEGVVTARVVIGADGKVAAVTMLESHPAFERAVREAIAGWRFRPYLVGDRAAPVTSILRFRFRLD